MKLHSAPFFAASLLVCCATHAATSPYDAKVEALLQQMTLEEKIGQMTQVDMNAVKDKADITRLGIGSVLSGGNSDPTDITPDGWRKSCAEFQEYALKTRLKIPIIYGIDAVHGHNNINGATVFPHNIGLGATHNPGLVEKAAQVTAQEIAATSMHWAFAPCVAVAQNPRWGRTYESFSDSPELVGQLGAAATRGFQTPLPNGFTVLASVKHFAGDGGTTDGVDQGNVACDEPTFRKLFVAPYGPSIKEGAATIMVSYNSWNGAKLHGHKHLLTDVLKGELGFQGFLISDWAAIDQLPGDYKSDIESSINAGLDMIMIPNGAGQENNYFQFTDHLKQLVKEGRVSQARVDDAVRRILRAKFQSGVFDHPMGAPELLVQVGSPAHREVARDCVRQSLVLLKNDSQALPLPKTGKKIAVVGAAANDLGTQCGGWTISWQGETGEVVKGGTTILEGIRKTVGSGNQITHSADASAAAEADAVIVVIGEPPYAEMKGDRTQLDLAPADIALVKQAKASGKPVVTVLLSGRPLILGPTLAASDAFVAAWLPGTEGQGVADVLFGDYRPTGKLPRIWPASNDQLVSNQPGVKPQFPFGYGLGY